MEHILSSLDSLFLDPTPAEYVIMEGYAFGGSQRGFVLGELGGLIKYHFQKVHGKSVIQIIAGHHKMYIANDYKGDKLATMKGLAQRFGFVTRDDNIADAVSMALLYRHMLLEGTEGIETSLYEKLLFEKVRLNIGRSTGEIAKKPKKRKRRSSSRNIKLAAQGDVPNPFEVL